MNQLQDIIADIKRGKCVLVLGPDIIDFNGKTFFESLCYELTGNSEYKEIVDSAPQHIFENEELFQPVSERYETDLQNLIRNFYEKQTELDIPLTQITQIPFHLIISLMPDDRLQKLFEKQNIGFNFGYYPKQGAVAQAVNKPLKEKPLVYNLLGDFNHTESIITFDDLFDFLSDIMGKKELPIEIQVALKEAGEVLFLGVDFEKWYAQLLLRIISPKRERKNKYTLYKKSRELYTFIARRFNLKILDAKPWEFLDALYQECGNQDMLRTVKTKFKAKVFISYSNKDSEIVEKIEQRLQKEQIEVVRDEISSHAGQKIERFIDTIKTVNSVLLVVSENSLQSPWVSKEIVTTLQYNKQFIPCYIDKMFDEDKFWEDLKSKIKNKVDEIGQKIIARSTDYSFDLEAESKDWKEFDGNLPTIKFELNRGIAKSFMPADFDRNIQQVIQTIINSNA